MHLIQRLSKALILLWKNCCSWSSSQPFVVQIISSSSENLCPFINSFSLGNKYKSHGDRTTHLITCQLKHWLQSKMPAWTTPSPTVFAIRICITRQMAGWKTKNNNSSITESELWRNAGPSALQLPETMLKSDKIWCAHLVANCIILRTFCTPLVWFTHN